MIQLIKNRKIPFTISAIVFVVSLIILFTFGLKPGIDFTGGSLLEVKFTNERPTITEIQEVYSTLDFGSVVVQPSDQDKMILRMKFLSENEHQLVLEKLRTSFGITRQPSDLLENNQQDNEKIEVVEEKISTDVVELEKPGVLEERFETIGPTVSSQLRSRSLKTAIAVVLAIIFYIAYAFRKVSRPVKSWKFGITAIIALVHDVVIAMAVFSLLGHFRGIEVDIPFVVALLTIMGYSVNDTIVVFDRIRENLIKRGSSDFDETVNLGVNQTFTRSINTSITTLLVLLSLFFFGGDSVHYFTLTLVIGVIVGTYSSIFLASPLLVEWQKRNT
jgi:preprotein translocase subunit SecF